MGVKLIKGQGKLIKNIILYLHTTLLNYNFVCSQSQRHDKIYHPQTISEICYVKHIFSILPMGTI